MLDWVKVFIGTYGPWGIIGLIALILVAQNAGLLPALHELAGAGEKAVATENPATKEQMARHIRQSEEEQRALQEIKGQLDQNRQSNATGFRILCMTQAKTDAHRMECAKIQ